MGSKFVYHGSKISGLSILKPKVNTHKRSYVYASNYIEFATMFIGDNFDFICQISYFNKLPTITERFKDALDLVYKGQKGSIYTLSAKTFHKNKTTWSFELVSTVSVPVIKETTVTNVLSLLEKYKKEGKINIYRYPNLPSNLPSDKEDLVEKAINWTLDFGEQTLDQVKQYHPDILERVISGLQKRGYKFKNKIS